MSRRLAALLAALVVAAAACTSGSEASERIPGARPGISLAAPSERQAAPETAVEVLGEERELSLADLRGDVVVLNFWASWCGPCRAEQPDLNAAAATLEGEPVSFLGVNIQDEVANARAHEREFEMPYPSLYDPSNAYAARFEGVGPRSIPSTIIVDQEGRVAFRLFGITNTLEILALTELLLEDASA